MGEWVDIEEQEPPRIKIGIAPERMLGCYYELPEPELLPETYIPLRWSDILYE